MIVRRSGDASFRELPGRLSADPFAGVAGADASVRLVRLVPGSDRRPHRHPRSTEVVYVAEGSGRAWQDGEERPVSAGDVVLVPRGVPHMTVPDGAMLLVCFFPDPDLATNLEEL
ncbi:MAG: cupin domain-containing protein [Streptosporangiales bacterium]|nr:cupin domain-containing protein [Streptosporangiales bacterium]MBO0891229.1 cupin domain-containing protein [Acidothermales bacterium]